MAHSRLKKIRRTLGGETTLEGAIDAMGKEREEQVIVHLADFADQVVVIVVKLRDVVERFAADRYDELEESARMDGANDIQILARIVLPMCKPVLATVVLFAAIYHWNAWYDSYVFTYKPQLKTLQAILVKILNQYQTTEMLAAAHLAEGPGRARATSESIRMTVTVFASVPIMLVYPFLQKHLLKGMMLGAIKG